MCVLLLGGVVYEVAKVSGGQPILIEGEAMPGDKVYLRLGNDTDLEGVEVSMRDDSLW